MRGFINFIQSDKILLRGTLISLALLLLHVLALSIFYRLLPPYVPVYNQLPWGSERLGSRLELFIPFGISTTLLITNLIIIKFIAKTIPLFSRILIVTSLLLTILSLIFTLRIIQLII